MTTLKICIIIFVTRAIYDLILHYSKPLYFKVKVKILTYIIKRRDRHICWSCIHHDWLINKCLFKEEVLKERIKKCKYHKKCGD